MNVFFHDIFYPNSRLYSDILIDWPPGSVLLYTYNMYQENVCNEEHPPVQIDKFDVLKGAFENPDNHFRADKLNDFHSCPLRLIVGSIYPPFLFEDGGNLSGMEWDMMNLLAETLNFRIEVVYNDRNFFDFKAMELVSWPCVIVVLVRIKRYCTFMKI